MKSYVRFWLAGLTVLVLISLALNAYFFLVIRTLRQGTLNVVSNARVSLAMMSREPLVAYINVDQEIPLRTSVPISQTFVLPLDIDYPLSTVVNTYLNLPLLGRQDIALPIETVIPIRYTLAVPFQMEIPISLTYPLQTTVPVEITIPPEIGLSLDEILRQAEEGLQ